MSAVLVVDDDALVGLALKVRLEALGYRVAVATCCQEAETLLPAFQPDLLLTDIHMPGCDGLELAGRLRAAAASAHIPIVFITASMEPQLRELARSAGAAGFLGKPYTPAELADAVARALAPGAGPGPAGP